MFRNQDESLKDVAGRFPFIDPDRRGIAMLAREFQEMERQVIAATKALGERREALARLAAGGPPHAG